MLDPNVNPAPIGPYDYVGDIHNILSPQLGAVRAEDQTMAQERGHAKVPQDPSMGTKTNAVNVAHSQREALGARRIVDKNTHATHRTQHPDKERNVLIVPPSGATHRDTFNQGPGIGYA